MTTWVHRYQKGKTSLDLNEAREDGVLGCSCISWTICKHSEPRSRQITTATPHCSIFTCQMHFLTPNLQCQSTEGLNHCKHSIATQCTGTACILCICRAFVRLSVPAWAHSSKPAQRVCCCGPGRQEISIDCCTAHSSAACGG